MEFASTMCINSSNITSVTLPEATTSWPTKIVDRSVILSLQLIPDELQEKWQKDLEATDSKLGGTADKPISSLLIMLETPEEMVVVCSAGEVCGFVDALSHIV